MIRELCTCGHWTLTRLGKEESKAMWDQIRAARAFLDWTIGDLSKAAGVGALFAAARCLAAKRTGTAWCWRRFKDFWRD
jgi:hypothetical protein